MFRRIMDIDDGVLTIPRTGSSVGVLVKALMDVTFEVRRHYEGNGDLLL